jgi:predicted 2-oxoglutarate/Fe(II)-dependent dioxygenase YbiX
MPKIGPKKNVVIIENFISSEECKVVIDSIDDKISWQSNTMQGIPDKVSNNLHEKPEAFKILKNAMDRLQNEIEMHFGRQLEEGFPGIRMWSTGEYQPLHADGEDPEGNPNEAYIVDYGSVLYLNDDYEGGEIYFPDQGIDFKPNAGTVVFFPSNNMYIHGVREITNGIRYTTPYFWTPTKYKIFEREIRKSIKKQATAFRSTT